MITVSLFPPSPNFWLNLETGWGPCWPMTRLRDPEHIWEGRAVISGPSHNWHPRASPVFFLPLLPWTPIPHLPFNCSLISYSVYCLLPYSSFPKLLPDITPLPLSQHWHATFLSWLASRLNIFLPYTHIPVAELHFSKTPAGTSHISATSKV